MPIQDIIREDVVTAGKDATVAALARQMKDQNVGSVIITNSETPIGIVTDRDLTTRILSNGDGPGDLHAKDVMSEELCSIDERAGFYETAQLMSEEGVRRLPVCDDDGRLSGIITADDMSELLAEEQQQLAAIIQAQQPAL
jgi:signal-transduction protein with cAMP-binding, CBS, and nucleotidyltransferase domain